MKTPNLHRLNFPSQYEFDVRELKGKPVILDAIRRRYVPLTPEEWVRQNLIQFLVRERGCPPGLTAVEMSLDYFGKPFRADVVVHNRQGQAVLLAECKEPFVPIDQAAFEQATNYNRVVLARLLVVTNGLIHYCWKHDPEEGSYRLLKELPCYQEQL